MAKNEARCSRSLVLQGGRCVIEARKSLPGSIEIIGGQITSIFDNVRPLLGHKEIDLCGYLIMPGLINAHDHLEFSLFPRLGNPPYANYIDWGEDIHCSFPDLLARYRSVPKDLSVWWGGIRNLLCGVTTVSHHNPLRPAMLREDFPVRVLRQHGWGHSLALGGNLLAARSSTPGGGVFIVHGCEGIDAIAYEELWALDRLNLLDEKTVLVHGLAIDEKGAALMRDCGSSLIVCPSSNNFLFKIIPNISILKLIPNLTLGNDSPLTAEGDLLDEIRFAVLHCGIEPETIYSMVTQAPASILRLHNGEGTIRIGGVADLVAIRDTGLEIADRIAELSMKDIELVLIGGRVQLAGEELLGRIPEIERKGLEPLWIDGVTRWIRADVKALTSDTELVLGRKKVRLGNRAVQNVA